MFSSHLSRIRLYKKKRDVLLYNALLNDRDVILKCTAVGDPAAREAYMDEYQVLSGLSHPGIPAYYGFTESFLLPGQADPVMAICMEDCTRSGRKETLVPVSSLTLIEILTLLTDIGDILSWLLDAGVLYTDLNPSNLIIHKAKDRLRVSLVDYTYSYFFLKNPYPAYDLRFSYNLSPELKGRQLLIQEMSYLLQDLLNDCKGEDIPSFVYRLLETGMNPPDHLSLSNFASMIQNGISRELPEAQFSSFS